MVRTHTSQCPRGARNRLSYYTRRQKPNLFRLTPRCTKKAFRSSHVGKRVLVCLVRSGPARTTRQATQPHHWYPFIVAEDNEAAIKIARNGRCPTMRHISRTHCVDMDRLHETCTNEKVQLRYINTHSQASHILTKQCNESNNLLDVRHKFGGYPH